MQFKETKLLETQKEAQDTVTFHFVKPNNYTWTPGQFFQVKIKDLPKEDPKGNKRTFTLANTPSDDYLQVTTRLRDNSVFKHTLVHGDVNQVLITKPMGEFTLPESTNKPIVFIAGGIGVTPFHSMIEHVEQNNTNHDITLLYSNRTQDLIAFKEELNDISKQNENINVVHTLTQEQPENWKGESGRVDENMINKYTKDPQNTVFYTAGPPKMVDAFRKLLKEQMNLPKENLKFENFGGY